MLNLCLVVVGTNQEECDLFDCTRVDCELHLIPNEDRATAIIANEVLAKTTREVFGLVHPDTTFGPGALEAFYNSAMAGRVCGIVGINPAFTFPLNYVWCNSNPGPVSALDDCSVFFRRDSGLTFDEVTFTAWSAHVPDLCLQAQARGIPIVVPAADATHVGTRYFVNHAYHYAKWEVQLAKLKAKWSGVTVVTT